MLTGSAGNENRLSIEDVRPLKLMEGYDQAVQRDAQWLQSRKSEFIEIDCPACGSSDSRFAFEKHSFLFRECKRCATIYLNPRPSVKLKLEFYERSEFCQFWAEKIFPGSEASRIEKIYRPRLARIIDICQLRGLFPERVLEIGAGFGGFASVLNEVGDFNEVVALEPVAEYAQACSRKGLRVLNKSLEVLDHSIDGKFDLVLAFEVIEHLVDPSVLLKKAIESLNPGGILILSAPNGLGFDLQCLKAASPNIGFEHSNLFNPDSIELMMNLNGYKDIETETPGKLDAELVRNAILNEVYVLDNDFLRRMLISQWATLGAPFQDFLAANKLSSHMWAYGQAG